MKKIILSLILAIIGQMAYATTRTVSNTLLNPGQYSTIAAAMTASANGDTILIQGSDINYGDVHITKPITLIGVGHNAQQQGVMGKTVLGSIVIDVPNLSGINIYGCQIGNFNGLQQENIDHVTIRFCKAFVITIASYCDYYIINDNLLGSAGGGGVSSGVLDSHDILITNNIINGTIASLHSTSCLISNNVFINKNPVAVFSSAGIYNAIISNNIFFNSVFSNTPGVAGSAYNCVFNNNITYYPGGSSNLPTGNGNTLNGNIQNTNPLFLNYPAAGDDFSYSYDFRLQPNSPGKNAGTDGTDIGVYGNNTIFSMTGEPLIPYVRAFNTTNNVLPAGGTLNVNFTGSDAFPGGN